MKLDQLVSSKEKQIKHNDKKVAFISCVNDEELYAKSLRFVNRMSIPKGLEIEFIGVRNANSIAEGYNLGIQRTDAKFKVYLHQDVFIIHKGFISDILSIFKENESIGMLGVIGARSRPSTGIWWQAYYTAGKVWDTHEGKRKLINFQASQQPYEIAWAVDGLLMATQYDVFWREDLFDGWHFYDISQCREFLKKGYKVVIPYQKRSWCFHDCGIIDMKDYHRYREIFLNEYNI